MLPTYKVLSQTAPTASTLTTIYTCPVGVQAVISSILVCNQTATTNTFRIATPKSGVSVTSSNYIYYDATIRANDTIALTLGLTLGASDTIAVNPSTGVIGFAVYGSEMS